MSSVKKVLIIKLGAIGDVVHTTVISSAIKQLYPEVEVHFLTVPSMVPLLENHPHIDKVIEWNPKYRKSFKYLLEVASQGRKEKYDVIFNMTRALRNIVLSSLMFPKQVVGKQNFGKSWVEEYFLTAKAIIKDLRLPERLYLSVNHDSRQKIDEFLSSYNAPYYLLFPAGSSDKHRQGRIWGMDSWKELTSALKSLGGTVFVSGSSEEFEEHLVIDNALVVSGQHSLMETLALMERADYVISGDSGPAHLASALGTATIALCGSTSPDKIKPFGKNGFAIPSPNECRFCWAKKCKFLDDSGEKISPCMKAITPNMVVEKIKEIALTLDKQHIISDNDNSYHLV